MKKKLLLVLNLCLASIIYGQDCIVDIPDANFKAVLVNNTSINTNGDTEISCEEASAVNNLSVSSSNIGDLTGIEAFINLRTLYCVDNSLINLNVSRNKKLTQLSCGLNDLVSLNLSSNTALTRLDCFYNNLKSLDVSNNKLLTALYCNNNDFTSLNIANGNNQNMVLNATNNPDLTCVQVDNEDFSMSNRAGTIDNTASFSEDCFEGCLVTIPDANFKAVLVNDASINTNGDTEISCLEASEVANLYVSFNDIRDLTGIEAFTNLRTLYSVGNLLTSLDVSNNELLTLLMVPFNDLESIDVSNNSVLTRLDCYYNNLESLDVSNNQLLNALYCNGNQFTVLNLANGNNQNMVVNATNNPELTCVEVDDENYSTLNWNDAIDGITSFSEDCGNGCFVNIPDVNFKEVLVNNTSINTDGDSEISCEEAGVVANLYVSSNNISDLTGIEAFTSLRTLYTVNNSLTGLDLSENVLLELLFVGFNDLENLDVSNNIALTRIDCYNNNLESLDVSNNESLVALYCNSNAFTSLNVANGNNQNMALNATNNPDLTCVQVDDASFSTLNWSGAIDDTASFSEDCSGEVDEVLVKVYPNPVIDKLTVSSKEAIEQIKVYDIFGKQVVETNTLEIDFTNFEAGMYVLQIQSKNGSTIMKQVFNQ